MIRLPASSRSLRWLTLLTIAIGLMIAVLAGFVMGPRRTPADDALDYVRRNGQVTGGVSGMQFLGITVSQRFEAAEVAIPIERLSDEMVSHLIELDSLQSIVLLGARPDKAKAPARVSLDDIKSILSDKSIAELRDELPMVKYYVIPASEYRQSR